MFHDPHAAPARRHHANVGVEDDAVRRVLETAERVALAVIGVAEQSPSHVVCVAMITPSSGLCRRPEL